MVNFFNMNSEVGFLGCLVVTQMAVVSNALVSGPLVLTQTMRSEALKGTQVTLELDIIVSGVNMSLQMSLLRCLVVTMRALVSNALVH